MLPVGPSLGSCRLVKKSGGIWVCEYILVLGDVLGLCVLQGLGLGG